MTTLHTPWQRIRNSIWLVCGLGCLLAALIFWAITDNKNLVEMDKSAETEAELQIQPEKVAATSSLGALEEEVRPLEISTRIVNTNNHEPEFRGTKFINDNKNALTLELFRVSKVEIIQSFLKKQPQRDHLFYIRLNAPDQIEQYALLYGLYKNDAQAEQALQQLALKLPTSIQPKIQALKDYAALVNDMGADESANNKKVYAVHLKAAALPSMDERPLLVPKPVPNLSAPVIHPKTATTNTTVTRRDQQGNVVDVQQSHSTVVEVVPKQNGRQNSNKPTESEISDPFN